MGIVIFNSILYIFLFLFYRLKRKKINTGSFLLFIYAFISVISIKLYSSSIADTWKLTYFPFLYLFFVLLIIFYPILRFREYKVTSIILPNKFKIKLITNIFIILSIISVFSILPYAIDVLNEGKFFLNRLNVMDEDYVFPYNIFQSIAINIAGYLVNFGILIFFYLLAFDNKKIKKIILIGSLVLLPTILTSITQSARGTILYLILNIFVSFLLFRKFIHEKIKKWMSIVSIIVISILIVFVSAVTMSRFGTFGEDALINSLVEYFGQSFLVFNDKVFGELFDYTYGKGIFKPLYELFGINTSINYIQDTGFTASGAFFTFIGSFYLDFGPFLVILIAIFLMLFGLKFFKNSSEIRFENYILYSLYFQLCYQGVFVYSFYGAGIFFIIFNILLYFFFKTNFSGKQIIRE